MRFKGTPATAVYFGVSKNTLKIWRNGNAKTKKVLTEGIHWAKTGKSVLYNIPLVEDWIMNHATNPEAHQKAIDEYRKTLPSHSL